jgi:hypothetical protein
MRVDGQNILLHPDRNLLERVPRQGGADHQCVTGAFDVHGEKAG